ncbi:MAG: tetratricopeptide repeat protein [Bacteroidota bacterium]
MKLKIIACLFLFASVILMYCGRTNTVQVGLMTGEYLNLNDTVGYVGMNQCMSCHLDIYETYIETGMGQSFDYATQEKSSAVFDEHAVVYDADLDFYYKPFWQDSVLYIREFRLEDGDTIHNRIERISYVIGSGQHTNSHLIEENGYIYQAPITFYTQDGKWDLAPGFEDGANSRFSRIIATECMTCHNHLPNHVEGSENKYHYVPKGIECERCHGPGEIHVHEKLRGNIIDTSKYIDYSIVNPSDLSVELEIDICQRCHLQGTAVLNDGKTFFDFKPGMELSEVMNVFLPRYTNAHDKFIMASQADRMRLSKCYSIGKMSCTSCHNPHKSVAATAQTVYKQACLDCHQKPEDEVCSEDAEARALEDNNCVNCHMPKSGSIDIPHVRITDHNIGIPVKEEEKAGIARFIGLECLTKDNPSDLEMAMGYLALFDKFVPEKEMLDSVGFFLNRSSASKSEKFNTQIHYWFNLSEYGKMASLADELGLDAIKDGWTAYRVGEAFYKSDNLGKAKSYFSKAIEYRPYNLDFQNKMATTFLRLGQMADAKATFEFILKENPKQPIALSNLGYINLLEGNAVQAEQHYNRAIHLDPDYEQAQLNLIGLYLSKNDFATGSSLLSKFRKRFPENAQAIAIEQQLKAIQ